MSRNSKVILDEIYRRLMASYGPQHWWPGDTSFEVMVGAILTQSAAWRNVEKAIHNLKEAGSLSPDALRDLPLARLAQLIRPCGYYNAKAKKLKALLEWLGHYGDDLGRAFASDLESLRCELLAIHGVGPETADSILLYAAGKPVFVIDAYTRRILSRIGLIPESDSYDGHQRLFMANLEADNRLFNEYHALLVRQGKEVCRQKPLCSACCLRKLCQYGQLELSQTIRKTP